MKALVSLMTCLLVLAGCGQAGAGTLVNSGGGNSARSRIIPVGERQPLPELSGATLQGDTVSSTDFLGDVLVINLWGSWCGPCRSEAPVLRDLATRTQDTGVRFMGLNTRDKSEAAQGFERKFGMPYPSLVDAGGQLTARTNGIVPINAIPSTIVVDRDGNVAGIVVGETTFSQLRELVRAADPAPGPPTASPTPTNDAKTEDTP